MSNIIEEEVKYIEFIYDNVSVFADIQNNLGNVNRKNIEIMLREKYNCHDFMEFLFEIFTVLGNEFLNNTLPGSLSEWVNDITVLSQGQYGITSKASIKYIENSLAIKQSKDIHNQDDIIHEFFVGTLMNTLRKDLPNFVFTLGFFSCDNSISRFCQTLGNNYKLLLEYINGKNLKTMIKEKKMTKVQFINIILQIFFSLEYAETKYKFVHNDLHTENIIVRQLRTDQIISYNIAGAQINIVTDMIPVIIDYGMSRIEYNNKPFGIKVMPQYGIEYTLYKPGIDVFRICCSILNDIGSDTHYDDVSKLLYNNIIQFLSERDSKKIIKNRKYENYCFPALGDSIVNVNAGEFIENMLSTGSLTNLIELNINIIPKGYTFFNQKCDSISDIKKKVFEKSPKKACSGNDWEKLSGGWKDKYGKERYWFECGEFKYDGTFNTVTFPKGMSLYHGSIPLSYYNTAYPLGLEYFDTKRRLTPQEKAVLYSKDSSDIDKKNVLKNAEESVIGLSYFGDHKVAMDYSSAGQVNKNGKILKCGANCISAYKLKDDITMVNLYDPFNMYVLLTDSSLSNAAKTILAKAYDVKTVNDFIDLYEKIVPPKNGMPGNIDTSSQPFERLQQAYDPFRRFIVKSRRGTLRDQNYLVPNELIDIFLKEGYSGFVNPRSPYLPGSGREGTYRFGELVFGKNVLSVLFRDYTNQWDWQYMDMKRLFGEIGNIVKDFMLYKTTNIDFHQGDLYQHSVWTALYVQQQFSSMNGIWTNGIPQNFAPLCIFAGFIHDIGKAGDMVYSFYDKKEHPNTGFEYFMGKREYVYRIPGTSRVKILDVPGLLKDVNLDSGDNQKVIAYLIKVHWEFGDHVSRLKNDYSNLVEIAREYMNYLDRSIDEAGINANDKDVRLVLYLMAMLISACDIMASSAYIDSDKFELLTSELALNSDTIINNLNASLMPFPYISNMGKVHRGDDKYAKFKIKEKGIKIRDWIIGNYRGDSMEIE